MTAVTLQYTEVGARSRALVASIVAVADQPEHVRALGAMLLELLEPGSNRDGALAPLETSKVSEEHPKNTAAAMDPPAASRRLAMSAAERQRKRRRLLKAAAVDARQLALEGVTPVTRCHAADVTNVTASVTRDVTSSSSDLLSSPRPSRGLGGERESSREQPPVTRDAVTLVTLPELLDAPLRAVFRQELERRPGVELDADALWRKFRRKKPATMALVELRNAWRHWCKTEWPTEETAVRQLPLSPPRREATKGAPLELTDKVEKEEATGPGVRSAQVDPEERSRRVEAAARERRARERDEVEREKQASGIRELMKLGDMFSPEAMEAARAAVFKTARKSA